MTGNWRYERKLTKVEWHISEADCIRLECKIRLLLLIVKNCPPSPSGPASTILSNLVFPLKWRMTWKLSLDQIQYAYYSSCIDPNFFFFLKGEAKVIQQQESFINKIGTIFVLCPDTVLIPSSFGLNRKGVFQR